MDIAVIGTGYVGLCSGVGLAHKGNKVICVGREGEKIDKINSGIPPIFEHGLEEMLKDVLSKRRFSATNEMAEAVKKSKVTFICVGTPSGKDGRIDLTQITTCAWQLGEVLKGMNKYHVFVVKSTVVPGTTEKVMRILDDVSGKKAGKDFGVCMNPEFLREGKALSDFLNPDRVVIGEIDIQSGDVLEKLYRNFKSPLLRVELKTAEMIKYASNSLLATKISFSNEIGNICKKLGIDVYDVMKGVGLDRRINPYFLDAGIGWGGSCFPKDVAALKSLAEDIGLEASILKSAIDVNERQKLKIVGMLETKTVSLSGKKIAMLGLAFKPGTDDIREAPSLDIIRTLLEKGASVKAYDPQAMDNMRKVFPGIEYCENRNQTLDGADACLILTDWEEFKSLGESDFAGMRGKIIIEGRKVLDKKNIGDFEGVCW